MIKTIPDQKEGDQILFSSRERLAMFGYVDQMSYRIGECERLVQTPVPLNYARHTSRFLAIWFSDSLKVTEIHGLPSAYSLHNLWRESSR